MARQSEKYHIDLINRGLEGQRQYMGNIKPERPLLHSNIINKLLEDLHVQEEYGINPSLKELRPSLEFNIPFGEKEKFNLSGGLNVPTRESLMDWLIKFGIDF